MKDNLNILIKQYKLKSIEDVVRLVPKLMCHIGQEPHIFGTYKKKKNISLKDAKKKKFKEKIKHITSEKYINYFINKSGIDFELISSDGRIASTCRQIAEVTARITSRVIKKDVFVVGKCLPKYVTGRNPKVKHHHYLNATLENDLIRYFDSAVYKKVFEFENNKWNDPIQTNFNPANIDFFEYIQSNKFLQTNSNQKGSKIRKITIDHNKNTIKDNFSTKKLTNNHYYFKKIRPNRK